MFQPGGFLLEQRLQQLSLLVSPRWIPGAGINSLPPGIHDAVEIIEKHQCVAGMFFVKRCEVLGFGVLRLKCSIQDRLLHRLREGGAKIPGQELNEIRMSKCDRIGTLVCSFSLWLRRQVGWKKRRRWR
jgi:hypothetical protein